MSTHRTRLALVTGSALTLILTGAGIVSAQTPNVGSQGTIGQAPTIDQQLHGGQGGRGGRGGPGDMGFGRGGDMGVGDLGRGAIGDRFESLVSQEIIRLDADGNVLTEKVEHGTVSAVADGSITIALATGESVTIATDANTTAFGWDATTRPARTEVAVKDIAAGADVLVWSQSQSDGSFLAQRITVLPDAAAATTDDGTVPLADPSPATVG